MIHSSPVHNLLQHYDPKRGCLYQFWMGIRFFGSGWALWWGSRRLQVISVIPILLTMGIFGGLTYLSFEASEALVQGIPETWPLWILAVIHALGSILAVVILVLLSYLLFFPIASVISIPFREALAAQTEQILCGQVQRGEAGSIWILMGDILGSLLFQMTVLIMTVGLGLWLPVGGAPLATLILLYLASLDMVDPALSLRGYLFGQKLTFVRSHPALMGGFGLMAFGLLGIPMVNLLILPIASVGGAVLVLGVLSPPQPEAEP